MESFYSIYWQKYKEGIDFKQEEDSILLFWNNKYRDLMDYEVKYMPGYMTHYIFGREEYKKIPSEEIR